MKYNGVGASSGIGIGNVVIIKDISLDYTHVKPSSVEKEKERLQKAIDTFCEQTEKMAEKLRTQVGQKESEILSGQIMIIQDPFLIDQMNQFIDGGSCAEAAIDESCKIFIDVFSNVEDELMKQRATDIKDICTRMMQILLEVESVDISSVPKNTVLVAHDFTPSMTVGIKKENVCGILTEVGGKTSHSAIIARALEIPAVLGISDIIKNIENEDIVIVDGGKGVVYESPNVNLLDEYRKKQREYLEHKELLKKYIGKSTLSADGVKYNLYSNIGKVEDAKKVKEVTAEGIGLFRTEFLFMDRNSMPTEDEQFEAYSSVSDIMKDKEVIIRTLDIGGDKEIPYLELDKEINPFLGYRAIRYCLDRKDVFTSQLRALLRASAKNKNIKIMLPLITCVDELVETKKLIEALKDDLKNENIPFDDNIEIGVMIETPAAALIADLLAKEADFFSIGTNDLTQYTMAVDRGNAKVSHLYSAFNPAVLRSIRNIIGAAKAEGIPVGMCGEAAADPCMIPLLMTFGLDEFSVSPSSVLLARKTISELTLSKAKEITDYVMNLTSTSEIEKYLESVCNK